MIKEQLTKIKSELPSNVILVAVSKTKPKEDIQEAYNAGQRIFGENRAQELAEKAAALPEDIQWHAIGNLQRKKVKYIAPYATMIHSVESLKLLLEINKEAKKHDRTIDCLLQFHIATESSKHGMNLEDAKELISSSEYSECHNVRIVGTMGMATFTDNLEQVRTEFKALKKIHTQLKESFFADNDHFTTISMGMSGDYKIAIEEGSTMVRIGSSIFGSRSYPNA